MFWNDPNLYGYAFRETGQIPFANPWTRFSTPYAGMTYGLTPWTPQIPFTAGLNPYLTPYGNVPTSTPIPTQFPQMSLPFGLPGATPMVSPFVSPYTSPFTSALPYGSLPPLSTVQPFAHVPQIPFRPTWI